MAAIIAMEIRYSPGMPTAVLVKLRLAEAGSCEPIRDAIVEIWHPDAAGQYSGYRGPGDNGADTSGETFLGGMQITDTNGNVEFETIYPGWYPGRTVHIHFKAYRDQRSLVTSQMYFPDDITDIIYLVEPYSARGSRSTRKSKRTNLCNSPAPSHGSRPNAYNGYGTQGPGVGQLYSAATRLLNTAGNMRGRLLLLDLVLDSKYRPVLGRDTC